MRSDNMMALYSKMKTRSHLETFSGTTLFVDKTINRPVYMKIKGSYNQTVTVQGKNLCDNSKNKIADISSSTGQEYASTNSVVTDFIKISNLQTWRAQAWFNNSIVQVSYRYYDNYKNYLGSTGITEYSYVRLRRLHTETVPSVDSIKFQLELGNTPTAYEPFVPDSPSPLYPSEITSTSNFNLISTNGEDLAKTINFQYTLMALDETVCDYIIVDNLAMKTWLHRPVGVYIASSSTPLYTDETTTYVSTNNRLFRLQNVLSANPAKTNKTICTHLKNGNPYNYDVVSIFAPGNHIYLRIPRNIADSTATLSAWFASQEAKGTPMMVLYELSTPIVTEIPYNEVVSYYPQTSMYTTALISPTLEGKFRIIG